MVYKPERQPPEGFDPSKVASDLVKSKSEGVTPSGAMPKPPAVSTVGATTPGLPGVADPTSLLGSIPNSFVETCRNLGIKDNRIIKSGFQLYSEHIAQNDESDTYTVGDFFNLYMFSLPVILRSSGQLLDFALQSLARDFFLSKEQIHNIIKSYFGDKPRNIVYEDGIIKVKTASQPVVGLQRPQVPEIPRLSPTDLRDQWEKLRQQIESSANERKGRVNPPSLPKGLHVDDYKALATLISDYGINHRSLGKVSQMVETSLRQRIKSINRRLNSPDSSGRPEQ